MPTHQTQASASSGIRGRKDRPLFFSAPMVRALLEGRKRQTRRLIEPEPAGTPTGVGSTLVCSGGGFVRQVVGHFRPRWRRGDHLWVKEAHMFVGGGDPGLLLYRATWLADAVAHGCENVPAEEPKGWSSPLFMARALSRLTLIVESVKVERLQDISEEDARAEGAKLHIPCKSSVGGTVIQSDSWYFDENLDGRLYEGRTARDAYEILWGSIHGWKSWDANPWVAAISFRAIPQNIDSLGDAL